MMHTAGMAFSSRFAPPLLSLLGLGLVGCGEPNPESPTPHTITSSIWVASTADGQALTELGHMEFGRTDFYDHPWPSDLRLVNGKVMLTKFPNPRGSGNIASYIQYMDGVLDGFSPAAAGFVRFTGGIAAHLLPKPQDTLAPNSPVQLINIDPASSEYGKRAFVSTQFRAAEGVYYEANTLAFMPTPGFPLRPHTRYAFVVTDALPDVALFPMVKSSSLKQVLGEEPATAPGTADAKTALEPAVLEIEKAGVDRKNILQLAVFTTNDPTEELFAVRDHLVAHADPPAIIDDKWTVVGTTDESAEYIGRYGPSPNYQEGKIPFSAPRDGGNFKYVGGEPSIVNTFTLRFSLTIPTSDTCPIPPNGYPIALYAHGTGGNFRSYVRDGTASSLAKKCIASMGIDQIFHGKRPGAPLPDDENGEELRFFNVDNVLAARTSNRQSALDEVQRARLFTETHIRIPAERSVWGQDVTFDPTRVMFFGHSQGGLNGPLFLASDDQALGGVLSGSGAVMSITLTKKTEPSPSVAQIVKTIMLGLKDENEYLEVDQFHPALSFAQMLVDVTDPVHYARHIINEPRPTMRSKSIYMTEGIDPDGHGDSFAPPRGIEMHAVAMGLPLIADSEQFPVPEMTWTGGPGIITLPFTSGTPMTGLKQNLAGMQATGGIAQWPPVFGSDGHFVVFDVPEARDQAAWFIHTLGYRDHAEIIKTQ